MAFIIPLIPYLVTAIVTVVSGRSKIVELMRKVGMVFEKYRLMSEIRKAAKGIAQRSLNERIKAHADWLEIVRTNGVAMIALRLGGKLFSAPFIVSFSLMKRFISLFDLTLSPMEMKKRKAHSLLDSL